MTARQETGELADTTVRELMEPDLVTVRPDAPVAELLELLESHDITGVPVLDPDETVVGVVSVTDVARAARDEARGPGQSADTGPTGPGHGDAGGGSAGFFHVAAPLGGGPGSWLPSSLPRTRLGTRAVRELMTPATFSVRPGATVPQLARFLSESRIHRALVLDGSRLAGLVSATDVLRAVARLDPEA